MMGRITWKILFVFSLFLTVYTFFDSSTAPLGGMGYYTLIISYLIAFFDLIVLVGSFGYAFNLLILNRFFWVFTAVAYPVLILTNMIFDFYQGGYLATEMITHSLLVFLLTTVLVLPVVMYINDFKDK